MLSKCIFDIHVLNYGSFPDFCVGRRGEVRMHIGYTPVLYQQVILFNYLLSIIIFRECLNR